MWVHHYSERKRQRAHKQAVGSSPSLSFSLSSERSLVLGEYWTISCRGWARVLVGKIVNALWVANVSVFGCVRNYGDLLSGGV